jgi:transposase-like protein
MAKRVRVRCASAADWRSFCGGLSSSGLTPAAYCKKVGIALSTYYRWRREFEDAKRPWQETPRSAGVFHELSVRDATAICNRVPAASAHRSARDGGGWEAEVEIAGGVTIRVRGVRCF